MFRTARGLYQLVVLLLLLVGAGGAAPIASQSALQLALASPAHVAPAAVCPATLLLGEPISCSISAKDEEDKYSFSASEGDKLKLILARRSGTLDPAMHLVDAADNEICVDFTSGNVAEISSCTLPHTGTYTLIVDDTYQTNTGDYQIYSQRLNNPVQAQRIVYGQTINDEISAGAEFDSYSVSGTSGDAISITMTTTEGQLRPRIRVYNLEGNTLCSAFSSDTSIQIKKCTFSGTGTFAILVDGVSESQTGRYSLLVECLAAACQPGSVFIPIIHR